MLFTSKWWKHVFIISVIEQPSLHHPAKPLTHPSLQWCCDAPDTADFIMFVCLFVSLSIHTIHPMAVPEFVLTQSNDKWLKMDLILCMPCKTGIWILVFEAHSIIHHPSSIHLSSIHPSIHSLHSSMHYCMSPSIIIFPSIHPCFGKDKITKEDCLFFFKAAILDTNKRKTCFV